MNTSLKNKYHPNNTDCWIHFVKMFTFWILKTAPYNWECVSERSIVVERHKWVCAEWIAKEWISMLNYWRAWVRMLDPWNHWTCEIVLHHYNCAWHCVYHSMMAMVETRQLQWLDCEFQEDVSQRGCVSRFNSYIHVTS